MDWQRKETRFRDYVKKVRFFGVESMSWNIYDGFSVILMQDSVEDSPGVYTELLYDGEVVEQVYIHSANEVPDAFKLYLKTMQGILEQRSDEEDGCWDE